MIYLIFLILVFLIVYVILKNKLYIHLLYFLFLGPLFLINKVVFIFSLIIFFSTLIFSLFFQNKKKDFSKINLQDSLIKLINKRFKEDSILKKKIVNKINLNFEKIKKLNEDISLLKEINTPISRESIIEIEKNIDLINKNLNDILNILIKDLVEKDRIEIFYKKIEDLI